MSTEQDPDAVAREYADEAVRTFADVMRDPLAENRDRLRAAENLLDRGHGKPVTPIAVQGGKRLRDQLAELSEDELYAIVRAEPLPQLTHQPIMEADFEEVDPLLR